MMLSKSFLIAALSASTVFSAKWTQVIMGSDDKCSKVSMVTQNPVTTNVDATCALFNGTCVSTGFSSLATSCVDDAPKMVPEPVKSGQWAQSKLFSAGECSAEPGAIIYQKIEECQKSGSTWLKLTCGGGSLTGAECKDDKCTDCTASTKVQTNFCNTTVEGDSSFKAAYITCFNNGQQSDATHSLVQTLSFGVVPLISAVLVTLF
jgi:hypothetical protein